MQPSTMQQETRNCHYCGTDFAIEPEDFAFYEKIKVPPPTWCPPCRFRRRGVWRNENRLYKRRCDFSGRDVFSMYPQGTKFPVYDNPVWYGDEWSPFAYGRDVDFRRPFLEQVYELHMTVPKPARSVLFMTNSDYCNNATGLKNCYLLFNSNYSEESMYGTALNYTKDSIDGAYLTQSERCYESFWLTKCNGAFWSSHCEDCTDIYFSKNLRGCNYCFGCVNLRNKSYCIFNEQYSKEEYFEKIKEFDIGSHRGLTAILGRVRDLQLRYPVKYIEGLKFIDSSGNYIYNAKNCRQCYLVREGEDLAYCQNLFFPTNKDCYDHTVWGHNNSLTYECVVVGFDTSNVKFCAETWKDIKNLEYCIRCESSSDLFGCVGVRKGQYCILNKQYAPEEYAAMVARIKRHMAEMPYRDGQGIVYAYGEFFPMTFADHAYNETIAQEHFPLTHEEALARGLVWQDETVRDFKPTILSADLPDRIRDVPDSITGAIVGCAHGGACAHACTSMYRIAPGELAFYRNYDIPLPRLCVRCRYEERMQLRLPFALFRRSCMCDVPAHSHGPSRCTNEFETSYAPERPEIVYCESCYQEEVS